jgi:hypothetical protein
MVILKMRFSALMKSTQHRETVGEITALGWRIKYQKRSIPHGRILFRSELEVQDIPAIEGQSGSNLYKIPHPSNKKG